MNLRSFVATALAVALVTSCSVEAARHSAPASTSPDPSITVLAEPTTTAAAVPTTTTGTAAAMPSTGAT